MTGLKSMNKLKFGNPDCLQSPLWSHGSRRVLEGLLWFGGNPTLQLWRSPLKITEDSFRNDVWISSRIRFLAFPWAARHEFLLEFHPSTPTYPTQGTLSSCVMLDAFQLRVVVTSQSVLAHASICLLEDMMQKLLGKNPGKWLQKRKTKQSGRVYGSQNLEAYLKNVEIWNVLGGLLEVGRSKLKDPSLWMICWEHGHVSWQVR